MAQRNRDPEPSPRPGYRPCVGLMVANAAGDIWIGRRPGAPDDAEGPDTWWQMPQGGIDAGEDATAAARRELFEETGMRSVALVAETAGWLHYDLPAHLAAKAWGGRYRGQAQKWFAFRFAGAETEINITPGEGHQVEFTTWRWAPSGTLLDLIVPFKREVYRAVLAELAPKLR